MLNIAMCAITLLPDYYTLQIATMCIFCAYLITQWKTLLCTFSYNAFNALLHD